MSGIRRKIAAAMRVVAPSARGAEAMWPMALARAARDCVGLDLLPGPMRGSRASLAELLDMPPDRAFVAMLEGPHEALGVMMLEPEVMAGVIERQTLGRVTSLPAEPRRPTRTDAAMLAGLIDAGLAALDVALEAEEDRVWAAGFRYASHLVDARPLALILDDATFRVLRLDVSLGGGEKKGGILLALPAAGRGEPPPAQMRAAAAHEAEVFQAALGEQVMASGSVLDAVLARITLPLAEVMALAPGEVLRLGSAAVDRIDVDGIDGVRLGGGRLGQNRGMRAVRLAETEPVARASGGLVAGLATVEVEMARTGTG